MATLHRLHEGKERDGLAVIFVHGLGGHPRETWMHNKKDHGALWPQWFGEETDHSTWTLEYDAALSAWTDSAMPLPDQGKAMLECLVTRQELKDRPLILVGHSLGGLVIKTALVDARTLGVPRYEALAHRVRGVMFAATPHNGSQLATLARAVAELRANEQVGDLSIHNAHLRTLHQQFLKTHQDLQFAVRTLRESRGVPIGKRVLGVFFGKRIMVVDPSSAEPHVPGEVAVAVPHDHFSICKPANANHEIHQSLRDFVQSCQEALEKTAATAAPQVATQPSAGAASAALNTPPPIGAAPAAQAAAAQVPTAPGLLQGAADNRLQPREGKVYGRTGEVAQVLGFLRSTEAAALVYTLTGAGGTGKTEVCKAGLKAWLTEQPQAAYYIEIPDTASPADLVDRMARALGAAGADSFEQLRPLLRPALYYLDNLESIAEQPEGQHLLQTLKDLPGVRLLASSRVGLPGVLGRPIEIDVLPEDAALDLFTDLWAGPPGSLPAREALRGLVVDDLGRHALSITLVGRLGDTYGYDALVQRWRATGTALAADALAGDTPQAGRLQSLPVSLRLTSEALARTPGTLTLWTLTALFPGGVAEDVLTQLEAHAGLAPQARQRLVRHHVLVQRGGRFHMLPPLARHALDWATAGRDGFDWPAARPAAYVLFSALATAADSIASTPAALEARRSLLAQFDALHRFVLHETGQAAPDRPALARLHDHLINQYMYRVGQGREMLAQLTQALPESASALKILGDLARRLGELPLARQHYDQALALYRREQNGLGEANALNSLGNLARRLGELPLARQHYDQALALYRREQNGLGEANALESLGNLTSRLGELPQARQHYDQALALYRREQNGLGEANALNSLGNLACRLGELPQARQHYDQALALYRREQDGLGEANALQGLGHVALGQDQPAQALPHYEAALGLYAQEQEPMGTAHTLVELARCHHALDDAGARDDCLRRALAAAAASNAEPVMEYVLWALEKITGSKERAQAWRARQRGDDAGEPTPE